MRPDRLPRKRLVKVLDEVRMMLAQGLEAKRIATFLERQYAILPLKPCPGAAHRNPHIDHCMVCAPRWGWVEADRDGAGSTLKEEESD
jgi:hypothetical protein